MLDRLLTKPTEVLTSTSQPIEPSPSVPADQDQEDELGDDADIPMPRFSLNLEGTGEEEEDDDSFHMPPPRLSLPLDDADHTERSIELGRRANSEQLSRRLSRGSFGTLRMSDWLGDATDLEIDVIARTPADDSTLQYPVDSIDTDIGDFDGQIDPRSVTFL